MTLLAALAATPSPSAPAGSAPIDASRVTPGLLGLLSFIVLIAAVIILGRSMTRHLRRVPPTFEPPVQGSESESTSSPGPRPDGADGPASDAADGQGGPARRTPGG
ncbi:MAG: hypothetical protein EPO13_11250 [Actinomycetota bacterium]|nr:MAG: hypothetical protein EPO13_11250 [Actinomycetota bacterium]